MTNLGTFIMVAACVGMGYVIEPLFFELRNADRNKSKVVKKEETAKPKKVKSKPVPTIKIDLSLVKPADFPETVSLRETFEIASDGLTLTLEQGAALSPVRLEGTDLIFKTKGMTLEHVIDVDQTDFKELVLPVMNARIQREAEMKRIEDAKPVVLDEVAIVSCMQASVAEGMRSVNLKQTKLSSGLLVRIWSLMVPTIRPAWSPLRPRRSLANSSKKRLP